MSLLLGIGSFTYPWAVGVPGVEASACGLDALTLVQRAQDAGLQAVQLGPNLNFAQYSSSQMRELTTCASRAGIELELGTKGFEPANLLRHLALCQETGARLLRTIHEYDGTIATPLEQTRKALNEVLPQFAAAQVMLGIENSVVPAIVLDRLIREQDSPWLGIVLDTVNSIAIPESAEHVIEVLAPHCLCLHVKDYVIRREWHMMGFQVSGARAGAGQLPIADLLNQMAQRHRGRRLSLILEQWTPPQSTPEETIAMEAEWARQGIEYLKSLPVWEKSIE